MTERSARSAAKRSPAARERMTELAVTVIGADRTGIVADVAEALAALGANLTDSSMTRLRGHFAMTLICAVSAAPAEVQAALEPLTGDAKLVVTVREVAADEPIASPGRPYLISVHGADRLGIVAAVTRVVADAGGNITDLSTRLSGSLYVLLAEADLPNAVADHVRDRLGVVATELGVEVAIRESGVDVL